MRHPHTPYAPACPQYKEPRCTTKHRKHPPTTVLWGETGIGGRTVCCTAASRISRMRTGSGGFIQRISHQRLMYMYSHAHPQVRKRNCRLIAARGCASDVYLTQSAARQPIQNICPLTSSGVFTRALLNMRRQSSLSWAAVGHPKASCQEEGASLYAALHRGETPHAPHNFPWANVRFGRIPIPVSRLVW